MFIIGLGTDDSRVEKPTWEEIRAAILALDNDKFGVVNLTRVWGGYPGMIIAGGTNSDFSGYVCTLYDKSRDEFTLAGTGSDDVYEIVVGGQSSDYPSIVVSTRDDVLTAAETFARYGRRDERFQWLTEEQWNG
jgi:hypothetical protein